ncbi:MAG: type II toxin-antitoxin system VapC family toxin [Nevskia sp.]|nr:type II toxin-antitoxin system VapC family toxin [Nevskia sp.]
MILLLDTHLLLWVSIQPERLPAKACKLLESADNRLVFSAVSLWEIAIKRGQGRDDFRVDPRVLRRNLLDNGYGELAISSAHAIATESLPPLHRDPFDRMLLAQAQVEGITLLTADAQVAQYPGSVLKV